jgi:hypothetical protein
MRADFPQLVSCNRFVELTKNSLLPLVVFLKIQCLGNCTGISFIDSTPLRACHIKREHSHKVLKGLATKGQCSIGWFFGLKLHFICETQISKTQCIEICKSNNPAEGGGFNTPQLCCGICFQSLLWGFIPVIINDKGEILDFVLTSANTDDRKPLTGTNILKRIYGKLFGHKGYISQTLFEQLFIDGIHLITKLRKNMKNSLTHVILVTCLFLNFCYHEFE